MPTGYTANIEKDITFKEYALDCARAFGACIDLRDEPLSTPIPEKFEESNYYKERVESAIKERDEFSLMSKKDRRKLFEREVVDSIKDARRVILERKRKLVKYEAMLFKVKKFVPPTEEHVEYKNFMISQIESSIDFDCDVKYYEKAIREQSALTFNEWEKDREEQLRDSVIYHNKHLSEEKARIQGRNKWISDMRKAVDATAAEVD
jgi:hypothetical protein